MRSCIKQSAIPARLLVCYSVQMPDILHFVYNINYKKYKIKWRNVFLLIYRHENFPPFLYLFFYFYYLLSFSNYFIFDFNLFLILIFIISANFISGSLPAAYQTLPYTHPLKRRSKVPARSGMYFPTARLSDLHLLQVHKLPH